MQICQEGVAGALFRKRTPELVENAFSLGSYLNHYANEGQLANNSSNPDVVPLDRKK
jgi:hypothetical protein